MRRRQVTVLCSLGVGAAVVASSLLAAGLAQGTPTRGLQKDSAAGWESSSAGRPLTAACSAIALPTLGGASGNVVATSSNGISVGIADDGSGVSRPAMWSAGRVEQINVGLDAAVPTGVNRHGLVVGTGYDPGRQMLVGWWWKAGTMHPLAVAPGDIAQPTAVDDVGHVVGSLVADEDHADGPGADEDGRAAYWPSPDTAPRELPTLPGDAAAEAFAIAPDGTVGGVSLGSGGSPVLWTPGGQVRRLAGLRGGLGVVLGFDAKSNPVGQASVAGGTQAVTWTGVAPSRLGTGRGDRDQALSGAGGIVVGSWSAAAGQVEPVAWANGQPRVLTPLDTSGFHGVGGSANAAAATASGTTVVGFSSNHVGLQRPTEWKCS